MTSDEEMLAILAGERTPEGYLTYGLTRQDQINVGHVIGHIERLIQRVSECMILRECKDDLEKALDHMQDAHKHLFGKSR